MPATDSMPRSISSSDSSPYTNRLTSSYELQSSADWTTAVTEVSPISTMLTSAIFRSGRYRGGIGAGWYGIGRYGPGPGYGLVPDTAPGYGCVTCPPPRSQVSPR